MMKKIYLAASTFAVVVATAVSFAAPVGAVPECDKSLFGIPPWYRNLTENPPQCTIKSPSGDMTGFIWTIALNVLQALMVIVAYVAIFFLIKGGFMYMTSAGSPDGMTSAKKTITNAIIGLIIALLAASIVNAIAGAIR